MKTTDVGLADRTGIPLTAALVDLDDFKTINDEEGPNADRALYEAKGVRGSRWTDYRMAHDDEDQGLSTTPRRRRRLARLIRRAS